MIEASFEAVVPKAINAEFEAIIPREKAFDIVNKDITIDTNGTYEVKADAGTAMTQVNVEVEVPTGVFQETMIDNNGKGIRAMTSIKIAEGVATIDSYAYPYAAITSVVLPQTLLTIGYSAFTSCPKLTSITIPDNVTTINGRAFMACSKLTQINLPSNLTTLGAESFQTCNISIPVIIPVGVATISTRAFYANSKIPYFDFRNHTSIPTLTDSNAFNSTGSAKFVVPDALYDQWIVATNWATYKSRIVKASEFVEPTNN